MNGNTLTNFNFITSAFTALYMPKTGDSATPIQRLGIALLASVGLAASVVRRRKRQNG